MTDQRDTPPNPPCHRAHFDNGPRTLRFGTDDRQWHTGAEFCDPDAVERAAQALFLHYEPGGAYGREALLATCREDALIALRAAVAHV